MPISVELRNGVETKDFLAKVSDAIRTQLPNLFRSLGDAYVNDVTRRIQTQDDGRWAKLSKWGRAKTGQDTPLLGTEKYIKARVSAAGLSIVSTARGFSMSDHDKGFVNKPTSPDDEFDDFGRVVIKVKDGRPLNLYTEMRRNRKSGEQVPRAQVFAFKAGRPGVTPARKIWATTDEAIAIGQPIASRWLQQIVNQAGGSLVRG